MRMADRDARCTAESSCAKHRARDRPGFQGEGFVRPERVSSSSGPAPAGTLISPRSAREFGVPANGANGGERPKSLRCSRLAARRARAEALDTGLYIGNLWYLNYSDRSACRLTGMTRFASFWVEGGHPVAPLNVMRFDDEALRLFGEGLVGLTERASDPESDTYGERLHGLDAHPRGPGSRDLASDSVSVTTALRRTARPGSSRARSAGRGRASGS